MAIIKGTGPSVNLVFSDPAMPDALVLPFGLTISI